MILLISVFSLIFCGVMSMVFLAERDSFLWLFNGICFYELKVIQTGSCLLIFRNSLRRNGRQLKLS